MVSTSKKKSNLIRTNTRIRPDQDEYIKSKAKRSKGETTEGEITRELLDKGIAADKESL